MGERATVDLENCEAEVERLRITIKALRSTDNWQKAVITDRDVAVELLRAKLAESERVSGERLERLNQARSALDEIRKVACDNRWTSAARGVTAVDIIDTVLGHAQLGRPCVRAGYVVSEGTEP